MAKNQIPTYALYGEFLSGGHVEELHYEPLHERSSKHGWDIQLHRHNNLAQIFLFRAPGVFIQVGDLDFQTTGATALFVPAMVAHGFRFPHGLQGDVISFPNARADDLQTPRLFSQEAGERFDFISQIIAQLAAAYLSFNADRTALMSHLFQVLLIHLRSDAENAPRPNSRATAPEMTKHEQQAHAFCAAIEKAFATQKSIVSYAHDIGVSAPHLTRVSKKVLGATPNELITRRRMVEAERLLKFTRHSIASVALRAGYADAPYFNRAFKTRYGLAPGAFRRTNAN